MIRDAGKIAAGEVRPKSSGNYRWLIRSLLLLATTINWANPAIFRPPSKPLRGGFPSVLEMDFRLCGCCRISLADRLAGRLSAAGGAREAQPR
jgi:hypothetical protein